MSKRSVKFDATKSSPPSGNQSNSISLKSALAPGANVTPNRTRKPVKGSSPISLNDLPESEKLKVGRLVEKLIDIGNKHEQTLQQLQTERTQHQQEIQTLQMHILQCN